MILGFQIACKELRVASSSPHPAKPAAEVGGDLPLTVSMGSWTGVRLANSSHEDMGGCYSWESVTKLGDGCAAPNRLQEDMVLGGSSASPQCVSEAKVEPCQGGGGLALCLGCSVSSSTPTREAPSW